MWSPLSKYTYELLLKIQNQQEKTIQRQNICFSVSYMPCIFRAVTVGMAVPEQHAGIRVLVEIVGFVRPAAPHLRVSAAPPFVALESCIPHAHPLRHRFRGQGGVRRPSDWFVPSPLDEGGNFVRAGRVGGHHPASTQVGRLQGEERVPDGRAERLAHERGARFSVRGGPAGVRSDDGGWDTGDRGV